MAVSLCCIAARHVYWGAPQFSTPFPPLDDARYTPCRERGGWIGMLSFADISLLRFDEVGNCIILNEAYFFRADDNLLNRDIFAPLDPSSRSLRILCEFLRSINPICGGYWRFETGKRRRMISFAFGWLDFWSMLREYRLIMLSCDCSVRLSFNVLM